MLPLSFLQSLEASAVGIWVRESTWGFAIVVGAHILGLAVSVGVLSWFDLRLLGIVLPGVRVSTTFRRLMPVAFAGFAVMFTTGLTLFVGYATSAYPNVWFRTKLIAIALAGANALYYHSFTEKTIAGWDAENRVPRAARFAGACSLLLWMSVILLGRGMSYTMF